MIDLGAGFIYALGKDLYKKFSWSEEEAKLVEFEWVESSGFKEKIEKEGYVIVWSKPDKAETRILDGYEYMYEIDESKKVRRKIVLKDGLVLLGKHNKE
jgi:hypothetical protein